MLTRLYIHNYAIIEKLDIQFGAGLNVITGETGAGKSILMGALNLILGERADIASISSGQNKCIVEGYFKINKFKELSDFFQANDLDEEEEIVLRREISSNGKSRSFINDTPVNLNQLKKLSVFLVDLHQQFDTRELGDSDFQMLILDSLADNNKLLQDFREKFTSLKEIQKELRQLNEAQLAAEKERDYNSFLFDELNELNLAENELETLDAELIVLNNSEEIKKQLSAASFTLKDSEEPVVQTLKSIVQQLGLVSGFSSSVEELKLRISSTVIELSDIADELERISDSVNADQEKIQEISDRLSVGYKLQKKHGVNSTNDLLEIHKILSGKLNVMLENTERISKLDKVVDSLRSDAISIAKKISDRRKSQTAPFTKNVNELLKQVGMPNAYLKISIDNSELDINGTDKVTFLFNANVSSKDKLESGFETLGKVASGGELSRLMLSVKSLVAKKLQLPTLIFDEIDSGISGEAAKQVARIMKSLSGSHQIITITHQPQIASKGDSHFFVYKENKGNKINTAIKLLNDIEKINAIAQMLSGENPTAAALENARDMVEQKN